MHLFSRRHGHVEEKHIQIGSVDDRLRNRLWNAIDALFESEGIEYGNIEHQRWIIRRCWDELLGQSVQLMSSEWNQFQFILHEHFQACEWFGVYDALEFIPYTCAIEESAIVYWDSCNRVLEAECSGYRFVDRIITPVTEKQEIAEIDAAILNLEKTRSLAGARVHLRQALTHFADRDNPDYRNSIKESISAVEVVAKLVDGEKSTLGSALRCIDAKSKANLHPALSEGFVKLYGYTSDGDGIRHAMMGVKKLDSEDARFMLVACSAFMNYLIEKARKAGIKLNS
jgi:hypothetical protein